MCQASLLGSIREAPLIGSRSGHRPSGKKQLKQPKIRGVKAKRIARRERAKENERDRQNDDFLQALAIGIPVQTLIATM